jgi:hypothetical protein
MVTIPPVIYSRTELTISVEIARNTIAAATTWTSLPPVKNLSKALRRLI